MPVTISIQFPDGNDLYEDFALACGYTETIQDPSNPDATIPNPLSKEEVCTKHIKDFIKLSSARLSARVESQRKAKDHYNARIDHYKAF